MLTISLGIPACSWQDILTSVSQFILKLISKHSLLQSTMVTQFQSFFFCQKKVIYQHSIYYPLHNSITELLYISTSITVLSTFEKLSVPLSG